MKVGTGGSLVAAVLLLVSPAAIQAAYTDVDILQFALNLECLEAEFYSWVATGHGLTSDVAGDGNLTSTPSGGQTITWTNSGGLEVAQEIAANELAHVKFLRAALAQAGATPIACPAVSISPETFTTAANASVVNAFPGATLDNYATNKAQFNPYAVEDHFYLAAFIFEDVGVTAYKGAIANLQNPAYASAAAGIMALEAGHSATIRAVIKQMESESTSLKYTPDGGASTAINYGDAANAITKLRDTLAGTSAESPIENVYAADGNAIAYSRTPSQVLDIVYFGSYTMPGGFYPNGVAGNTTVTEITANSTRMCSSGATGMASLSVVTVAVVALAAAFAL